MDIINRFFRIGYFKIKGYANFEMSELKEDFQRPVLLRFQHLCELKEPHQHVDVRSRPEYEAAGVLEKALLIPLPELENRIE